MWTSWPALGRVALVTLFAARLASAQPAPAPPPSSSSRDITQTYSEYEADVTRQQLERRGYQAEPAPDGKLIESIEIVSLEVFDERDPVPDFVNVFHVTSRDYVIRRELLFSEGHRYYAPRVEESARNLRTIRQLSLVLILPVRGSAPDRVRILVITKDVWSLRLNWDVEFSDGQLARLVLNPSEENLFGTQVLVGGLFRLRPDTYSLGGMLSSPRVGGSRLQASVGANVILNRSSGEAEGSYGYMTYEYPLYSLATEWGFRTSVAWLDEVTRSYVGLSQRLYDARPRDQREQECAGDPRCIPFAYLTERWLGETRVVRSFGRRYKFDLSFGAEVDRRWYRVPELSGYDPAAVAQFERRQVPMSDTRISPVLQLHARTARFVRLLDVETLSLQEELNLGPEVLLRLYPASTDLGSSRDMVGTLAAASYTFPIDDGFVRAIASSTIEIARRDRHDALLELRLRATSPRSALGRLTLDGQLLNRYQNYLNRRFSIGGDTRPRGYPLAAFLGKDVVAASAEFRSRPIEIFSAQLGAALFYDVGDAFDGWDDLELKHGVGAGLRVLLPQFDRSVFRVDWGVPLNPGYTRLPGSVLVTFKQAFGLPALVAPSITGAFTGAKE